MRLIHQEIGLLKDENQKQNNKIDFLIEIITESQLMDKTIHQNSKIKELEKIINESHQRPKRPYRLLPSNFFTGDHHKNGNKNQDIPRFNYGPPTSCSDLSHSGYTLNGFYLVKPAHSKTNDFTKLETVFCAFKQPEGTFDPSKTETRISPNLKPLTKISGIHFHAQTTQNGKRLTSQGIKFEILYLNMGGAFDLTTGIFTVPKSGIYRFIFKGGLTRFRQYSLRFFVHLYHNARVVGSAIYDDEDTIKGDGMIEATLKLYRGDTIYLKPWSALEHGLEQAAMSDKSSFSGSLLEELDN